MSTFVESFDAYNGLVANTGLLARWYNTLTAQSARQALVAGRFGVGQAYSAGAGSGGAVHQTNCLLSDYTGNLFDVTAGFSMHVVLSPKSVTANGGECGFCLSNSSDIPQLGLRWLGNKWQLVRWGAAAGGSPAAILWESAPIYTDTTPRHFQLKGIVHATTGVANLKIDDVEVYSATGLNTGTGAIDRIAFCQGNLDALAGVTADDIVIQNQSATYLPPLRIDPYAPNADGGTLNLVPSTGTTHYALVDEAQVATSDYLSGSVVGDHDLLGLPDMAVTPDQILGVNLVGFAAKTDVTARSWNLGCKSGSTDSDGPALALATSAGYYHRLLETDPATAAAWLKAGFDGMQLKPRVAV